MVARIPTAQVHRPCDGDAVVGVGDANRQRECPGDVSPHAQAFHRGNASQVKPPFPGARQNSSEKAERRSFDSSFPSLPSVTFSGRQAQRRIPTNKGNEELGQGQEGESGSRGRGINILCNLSTASL